MFNAGVRGKRAKDGVGFLSAAEQFNQKSFLVPTVTSFSVTDVSYVPLDNTAVDTAGGETIVINGSGFASGATVQVGATTIGSVTFIDQNRLAFAAPALSSGSYTIYVTNSNGGTGILVSGLVYSGLPTYSTSAGSLGTVYETANINTAVVATGDAPITYSVISGTLPSGATLNSNGTITGNAPVDGSSTTYSFTIQASDGQLQDSTRSFSLTINTDVLTWGLANNTVYTLEGNSVISNVTLSATSTANSNSAVTFSANTLPTGVSLSGNTIFGTPTVEQTVYSALTATATQTGRTATRFVSWIVSLGEPYWKNTSLLLTGNSPIDTFVTDASTNNFPVTINGDTKPNNFNPFTPGRFSNFTTGVSGTTNKVDVTSATIGGSGVSYTIEGWFYFTAANSGDNQNIFCTGNNVYPSRWIIDVALTSTTLQMRVVTESNSILFNGNSVSVNLNTWVHLAVVNDAAFTFYVNGVAAGSRSPVSLPSVTSYQLLCNSSSVTHTLPFYVSNYRIVNGAAVYTAAFTPSATPLTAISGTALLAFQTPVLTTTSVSGTSITLNGTHASRTFNPFIPDPTASTYGSAFFDGTGDYLTLTGTALGGGNFTIELWGYFTSYPNAQNALYNHGAADGLGSCILYLTSAGTLSLYNFTSAVGTSTTNVPLNTWTHIAVTRVGSTLTYYINGVASGTGTSAANISETTIKVMQGFGGISASPIGYISNLRTVVGTAVYTANFTPPTVPLTAITNTSLLTLQTNQAINNNLFIDDSTNNFAVTRAGNTTQGTFSPYGANWSNYFDGTGDYLSIADNSAFRFGTGNFTIECWINTSTTTKEFGKRIVEHYTYASNDYGWILGTLRTAGYTLAFYGFTTGTAGVSLSTTNTVTPNVWHHVAVVRSGSVASLYLDGTRVATQTGVTWNDTDTIPNGLEIGQQGALASTTYDGYISNIRLVKGTAVYDPTLTTLTVPITPLTAIANTSLLTCADNRFIDDSTNNFAITRNGDVSVQRFSPFNPSAAYSLSTIGGSGYFDGSGDYLSIATSTAFSFGTGDFTVEGWVYKLNAANAGFIDTRTGAGGVGPWAFYVDGSNFPYFYDGTVYTSSVAITLNAWTHIAATRSGNTLKIFVNGVQGYTSTVTTNMDRSGTIYIGVSNNPASFSAYWLGFISNLRVVKGTAVYTAAFTPPTAPVTATNNTSLLLNFTDAGIVDNTMLNNIETFGDARVSRAVSKFGSGAMFFDGTGDYLKTPSSPNLGFGTGDFTVECWINTSTKNIVILDPRTSNSEPGVFFIQSTTGFIGYYDNTVGSLSGTTNVTTGAWFHLAWTRSGTTFRMFVNGTQEYSGTNSGNFGASRPAVIGASWEISAFVNGYIDDLRITKGVARYTSNFTAPTAAFQTK
jgi:hypothetical protein